MENAKIITFDKKRSLTFTEYFYPDYYVLIKYPTRVLTKGYLGT
jgi:hypothetical protein